MTWLIPTDQLPAPGRALARNLWDPRQPLAEPPTPEHLAAHPTGQTIRAATDYMDLIDQDWLRIADWYRPGTTPQHRLDHRELWQEGEGSLMIAQLQRTNIKTPRGLFIGGVLVSPANTLSEGEVRAACPI